MPTIGLTLGTAQGTTNWHTILEANLAKLNLLIDDPLNYNPTTKALTVALSSLYGGGTGAATLATTGTEYLVASGIAPPGATENDVLIVAPVSGTIRGLRVFLLAAPGAGTSRVFTVRINGADTDVVVTISETDTDGFDAVNDVAVTAGDRVTISSTVTGTPAASAAAFGWELVH